MSSAWQGDFLLIFIGGPCFVEGVSADDWRIDEHGGSKTRMLFMAHRQVKKVNKLFTVGGRQNLPKTANSALSLHPPMLRDGIGSKAKVMDTATMPS